MYKVSFFLPFLIHCFIFCSSLSTSEAQTTSLKDTVAAFRIFQQLSESTPDGGTVKINADHRLESVMQNHFNKGSSTSIKGWRIRIFRDNRQDGRQRAEQVMASVRANYPGTPVYLSYEAPHFYVAVGDYRSRDAAEKMKRTLQIPYPGASLIEETIKFPPL